jgi:hypothetical protein
MKQIILAASLGLLTVTPVFAEEDKRGLSLMEEGARLFMEGILREMEPAIDELEKFADEMEPRMRDFAEQMGPALRDLMGEIQDWSAYHPPEVLPNGDIIIRKKTVDEMQAAPSDETGATDI